MATGLAITTISAAHPILYNAVAKLMPPICAFILWIVVMLGGFYILGLFPSNSVAKYAAAAILAALIGQISGNTYTRLENEDILYRMFFLTTGIFIALLLIGLYDNQNFLSLRPYLFAVLIGLILSELVLYLIEMLDPLKSANLLGLNTLFTFISVGIFSLYSVVNMQVLKDHAKMCVGSPDYINEAQALFLTYINLFQNISSL